MSKFNVDRIVYIIDLIILLESAYFFNVRQYLEFKIWI